MSIHPPCEAPAFMLGMRFHLEWLQMTLRVTRKRKMSKRKPIRIRRRNRQKMATKEKTTRKKRKQDEDDEEPIEETYPLTGGDDDENDSNGDDDARTGQEAHVPKDLGGRGGSSKRPAANVSKKPATKSRKRADAEEQPPSKNIQYQCHIAYYSIS